MTVFGHLRRILIVVRQPLVAGFDRFQARIAGCGA
jgi:hypothetical protein